MIRFLDPWMLLFAVAAAVPPLIVWLSRHDAVVRDWAAMEILARAAKRTAVARRLVDWLVVTMRCATLLLVAFAAARPLFERAAAPDDASVGGKPPRERSVLVVGDADAVTAAIEAASPADSQVRSIRKEQLADEPFEEASLVVLADGVVPEPATNLRLQRYVDRGGAVVVLVGPRSTDGRSAEAVSRFVAGLAGIGIAGPIDAGGEGIRLAPTAEGDAALELRGPTVTRLATLVTGRSPPGSARGQGDPVHVLARLAPSGEPLAIEARVGGGAVGVIAVPLAVEGWSGGAWSKGDSPTATDLAAWTDLPAWPAFLPFVERTILTLAAAGGGQATDRSDAGLAGWLAAKNLAGLSLVAALALVMADPLASLAITRRSRIR